MESSFVVNLHFKNKITQKKVSNEYNMFKNQLFKSASLNDFASNYTIEYYEKHWIVLDEKKFKRFSNLFKKEVRIVINSSKIKNLAQFLVNTFNEILKKHTFKKFKNYLEQIKKNRLEIKNDLNNKIDEKKKNEYFNLVTSDNAYQNNIIKNNFDLYYTLNDLVPTYKRLHINFHEMNLIPNPLED